MKLQASSIYRAVNCPGSMDLETKIPKEDQYRPFSDAASRGSAIHDLGEAALLHKLDRGPNPKLKEHPQDHREIVEYYVKYVTKLVTAHKRKKGNTQIMIEEKFRYHLDGVECVFKADALVVTEVKEQSGPVYFVDIFDLKTGNFDYTTSARDQLNFSAALYVSQEIPEEATVTVNLRIVQPALWDEAYRAVKFGPETYMVEYWTDEVNYYIHTIKTDKGEFTTGDHCTFCPVLLACPKMTGSVNILTTIEKPFTPDVMNNDQLEYLWHKKSAVEKFLKAVDATIMDRLQNGARFPGLYLKPTNGRRRWIDQAQVEKVLAHLGDDLYEPAKLKSPTQLEKIAGKENIVGLFEKPQVMKIAARDDNPFGEIE